MAARSSSALRQSAKTKKAAKPTKSAANKAAKKTTKLPVWNLADLYSSITAPEIARDLDKLDADCVAFEAEYKGKIADALGKPDGGAWLANAVKAYEAIDDLAGRLISYAGLIHAGDTVDPAITKFYGDVSERLTNASTHLLFFTLELNRVDDDLIEK